MSAAEGPRVEVASASGAATGLAALAGWILRRWGWTICGHKPDVPKYVMVASPHTSYWDTPVMLLCAVHLGIRLRWLVKAQATRGLLGLVLRRLGGIPVDRSGGHGAVARATVAFRDQDELALALAPDGTRRYCAYWRSGFYHIARAADVPILCGFQDWGTRRVGMGPTLRLSGDVKADMDRLRAFYGGMAGKHPERTSRIRLKEEDGPVSPSP